MKHSKDPFEGAVAVAVSVAQDDDDLGGGGSDFVHSSDNPSTARPMLGSARRERINKMRRKRKITWMLSFGSLASTADPDKMANMQ